MDAFKHARHVSNLQPMGHMQLACSPTQNFERTSRHSETDFAIFVYFCNARV